MAAPTSALSGRGLSMLGASDATAFGHARAELHHAAQLLAAFAQAYLPARPDDSHRSLAWHPDTHTLRSDAAADGTVVALRVEEFRLEVLRHGEPVAALELQGVRPDEAKDWLERTAGAARETATSGLVWPEYDIPPRSGVRTPDAPFAPGKTELAEFGAWFDHAHRLLLRYSRDRPEASAVRCWPHHFDIAVLSTWHADEQWAEDRFVGVGLSPGDEGQRRPYWYVNGWPQPDPAALPPLQAPGAWNVEGWVGGILTAAEFVLGSSLQEHDALAEDFVLRASQIIRTTVVRA